MKTLWGATDGRTAASLDESAGSIVLAVGDAAGDDLDGDVSAAGVGGAASGDGSGFGELDSGSGAAGAESAGDLDSESESESAQRPRFAMNIKTNASAIAAIAGASVHKGMRSMNDATFPIQVLR